MKVFNEDQKTKFIEILRILVRYYEMVQDSNQMKDFQFRKELVEMPIDSFQIEVKKIGDYEFNVKVIVGDKVVEWVHIDGIMEERNRLKESNNLDHPVFRIVCLTDIYNQT